MEEHGKVQGLPLDELDITPTPEERAGKIANAIFRPWYKEYYEGQYTQSTAFIAKVLKQTVLKCVIEGEDDEAVIVRAMQMLGLKQQVVTEASLQYAISHARREAESRREASLWYNDNSMDGDSADASNSADNEIEESPWGDAWLSAPWNNLGESGNEPETTEDDEPEPEVLETVKAPKEDVSDVW